MMRGGSFHERPPSVARRSVAPPSVPSQQGNHDGSAREMHDGESRDDARVSESGAFAVSKHVNQGAGDRDTDQESDVAGGAKATHADQSPVKPVEQGERLYDVRRILDHRMRRGRLEYPLPWPCLP